MLNYEFSIFNNGFLKVFIVKVSANSTFLGKKKAKKNFQNSFYIQLLSNPAWSRG